jgi:hypothetical protein
MNKIKRIEHDGVLIAIIILNQFDTDKTIFHTPDDSILQVGHVALGPNRPIQKHIHNPIERRTKGTAEVLILIKGRVEVSLYAKNLIQIHKEFLVPGDVICLVDGGHGFEALEESTFVEVKNGPFVGQSDKVYF